MDERDKPKGEPTKPVKPSLPNVVRKQRPCGNQHYNAWSAPPTIESDGYEVGRELTATCPNNSTARQHQPHVCHTVSRWLNSPTTDWLSTG